MDCLGCTNAAPHSPRAFPRSELRNLIVYSNRFGINSCEGEGAMAFEAAWGTDGAVCVAPPRNPELVSLDQLRERFAPLRPSRVRVLPSPQQIQCE